MKMQSRFPQSAALLRLDYLPLYCSIISLLKDNCFDTHIKKLIIEAPMYVIMVYLKPLGLCGIVCFKNIAKF